jgi:hypothetical protein
MVQFTIEYVALGFAVLLVAGGLLALFSLRSNPRAISPLQRVALLGGLAGMVAFIVVAAYWRLR